MIPASGPKDAKIALVGEAPGAEEDRQQKVFVGAAGQKLDELLHIAGLSRTSLYITNVVKERPANNNIELFISFGRTQPKCTQKYLDYVELLRQELLDLKPNVVCALGNVALYALTGKISITDWRGSIVESTLIPGLKVIPTIHPAAALRQYIFSHQIVADLTKVNRESSSPEIILPPTNFILRPSFDQALSWLDKCLNSSIVAVDIEVVSQEIECLGIATSPNDSCCIVLYDQSDVFTIEEEALIWSKVGKLLETPDVVKIFQNAVFDCFFFFERFGFKTRCIDDTMIAQGLITPDMPKGLDFITSIYTDLPYYKKEGKEWYKNPAGSAEGFWRYNCLDTIATFTAWKNMIPDLDRLGLFETYQSHIALIPILLDMQHRGIKVNEKGLRSASAVCAENMEILTKQLHDLTGTDINPKSPSQLMNYFYVNLGIKPYVKDGKPTTDEKAMKKIALKGHKAAQVVLDIRKNSKLKSTYLDVKLDDGRLKCSYNPIGTSTGRLSSSRNIFGLGTNMQNLPKEVYRFLHVDDGYIGYSVDLGGAESRVVAYCGPVPVMRDAYDRGLDLHSITASRIFNIPVESVSRVPGSAGLGDDRSQRDLGKMTNHSSNYDIGPRQLAEKLEILEADAKRILDAYHSQYPEVRGNFHNQIKTMLRNGRRVFNPLGRSRLFLDRWGSALFQDAYAFFPQSTVSDVINRRGMTTLAGLQGVEILNQVHDSLEFQLHLSYPWDYHKQVLTMLCDALEAPIKWKAVSFSIPAECKMMRSTFADTVPIKRPFDNLEELFTVSQIEPVGD